VDGRAAGDGGRRGGIRKDGAACEEVGGRKNEMRLGTARVERRVIFGEGARAGGRAALGKKMEARMGL